VNPTEYFRINLKTQYPEDVLFDARALIINKELWNSIRNGILELLEDCGPDVLYHLGLNAGTKLGQKACSFSDSWLTAFSSLADYCFDAGWGRIDVDTKESRHTLNNTMIDVRENFFVQGRPLSTHPSCYFLAGMFAGIASSLLHERYLCLEQTCIAAGSSVCRFKLVKRGESD